ncbi:MAG TPA: TerB family tellurite resistance protein [Rhodothermales bacterium]
MDVTEGHDWTPLHDLALLYLALVHGGDAQIAPAEMEVMATKLKDWYPGVKGQDIARATEDVLLVYVSESGHQMLEACVASLNEHLHKGQRIAILNDLAEIASADGMLAPGEVNFIQQLAMHWGVDAAAN